MVGAGVAVPRRWESARIWEGIPGGAERPGAVLVEYPHLLVVHQHPGAISETQHTTRNTRWDFTALYTRQQCRHVFSCCIKTEDRRVIGQMARNTSCV